MKASLSNEFRSATRRKEPNLVMNEALGKVKQSGLIEYGENSCT